MGNSNGQTNDMVSVYLNYGDQKSPEGWHVCAQFALAISNPNDPTVYIQSRSPPLPSSSLSRSHTDPYPTAEAHHRFTQEEQDWGFTRFVELRKLFSVSEGRTKPIIENDETIITAYVRVLKDPTGVLWHNFHKCVLPLFCPFLPFPRFLPTAFARTATTRRRRRVTSDSRTRARHAT